jgi:hypothetical protein
MQLFCKGPARADKIRTDTHYHPCVVSNLSLVTTSDGEIADKLNKVDSNKHRYEAISSELDNETYLADVRADRIRCNWLCEA